MRQEQLINNSKEHQIIYKYQPRDLNLEVSREQITAILDDGRKLTIPTA
jgi:hypothetical protein